MLVTILITYVALSIVASVIVLAACIVAGRSDTRRGKYRIRRNVSIRTGGRAAGGNRTHGNTRLVPR